jgi:hypothetical protein
MWIAFVVTLGFSKRLLDLGLKGKESLSVYKISPLQLLSQSMSAEVVAALDQIQQIITNTMGLEALARIPAFTASLYWGFTWIR